MQYLFERSESVVGGGALVNAEGIEVEIVVRGRRVCEGRVGSECADEEPDIAIAEVLHVPAAHLCEDVAIVIREPAQMMHEHYASRTRD